MRILEVRLHNLNSLYGPWRIDFTDPAFAESGIFAVGGPTGAGKSTILDAICLALYGRTPRLGRVGGDNEIMSRGSGECGAEVRFVSQKGEFRSVWTQRRAHKRPDGALQQAKHEIHEIAADGSARLLTAKMSETAARVEAATGMDFDRFTRSMLLAQGGFAAFLNAAPDARAPVLEQITGTEIYSRISKRVHERKQAEERKRELLLAEQRGIALLVPEEEAALSTELASGGEEERGLAAAHAATGAALAWHRGMACLSRELADIAGEEDKLAAAAEDFRPDRDRLEAAERAVALGAPFAALAAARARQRDDQKQLRAQESALPVLVAADEQGAADLASAETALGRVRAELETAVPLFGEMRALDRNLFERRKALTEAKQALAETTARLEGERRRYGAALAKRESLQADARKLADFRETHAADAWLAGGLAGVEEQAKALTARQEERHKGEAERKRTETALAKTATALERCRKASAQCREVLASEARKLVEAKEELARLLAGRELREYRAEKEACLREMALLARIAELEEHRRKLEDGKPCPLCGATAHPYAEGNVPQADAVETRLADLTRIIDAAEAGEAAIRQMEAAQVKAQSALAETEMRELAADRDRAAAEAALADMQNRLTALEAAAEAGLADLADRLRPLGVAGIPENGLPHMLAGLRERLAAWQDKEREQAAIDRELAAVNNEITRLEGVIGAQHEALSERRERYERDREELAACERERLARFGDREPDAEEERLKTALSAAEAAEQAARARRDAARETWTQARAQLDALSTRIAEAAPELARLEAEFAARLPDSGFADEAAFLAARLPEAERSTLKERAAVLERRGAELAAMRRDREAKLAAEQSRNLSPESPETLEPRLLEEEAALSALRERLAGIRARLADNGAAKAKNAEKLAAIAAQEAEWLRFKNLHELIGSADGKKFRNFAQGLTFDLMIAQANRQLEKMSDRYLLVRDAAEPLVLNVIDNWQGGQVRGVKNLSGGESFLVSLALALGLSAMSSRNVRVDSLFLDEGFGSLDEDSLETALETLAGLRAEGKLIGVISHVPALHDRIPTRIRVAPLSGGRSRIEGPGCSGE